MKRIAWLLLGLFGAIAFTACGGGQPDPGALLDEAADVMADVESLTFELFREGEPLELDLGVPLEVALLGAEGLYSAPDTVYAIATISPGPTEAQVWWSPLGTFVNLAAFPTTLQVNFEDSFNAVDIFDEEVGLPAILRGLEEPEFVGEGPIEDVQSYQISAASDGEDLSNLVGGALEPGPMSIDVWVTKDTKEVVHITITEENGDRWLIYFTDFNIEVEIPQP